LRRFRRDVHACRDTRGDALFELADAVLCAAGPVRSLAQLSLEPEHQRGHGSPYDGLNTGQIAFTRVRRALDGLALPRTGPWQAGDNPAAASPTRGQTYTTGSTSASGGVFTVTATVTWSITWAGGGQTGALPALTTTATAPIRVAPVQTVVLPG
jgi:DDE superfamily endonuclease